MSKAVLISIRPKWCEKIARGEKTVEVRKTRPKLETPFKVYIYCTNQKNIMLWNARRYIYVDDHNHNAFDRCWNGSIVGEFVCDRIDTINPETEPYGIYDVDDDFVAQTGLVDGALWDYGKGATLYGWHISKLEIYDTPKPLSEFSRPFENCIGMVCGIKCCGDATISPSKKGVEDEHMRIAKFATDGNICQILRKISKS